MLDVMSLCAAIHLSYDNYFRNVLFIMCRGVKHRETGGQSTVVCSAFLEVSQRGWEKIEEKKTIFY